MNISNSDFDTAFNIRNSIRKNLDSIQAQDQIPEIGTETEANDGKRYSVIDGAQFGEEYSSLYFYKLDRLDPRILFIGHLTDCCNKIGDITQYMAIAQAKSPHGGCYVLAQKSKQGEINPKEDTIVSKTTVWKAQSGNLVFLTLGSREKLF